MNKFGRIIFGLVGFSVAIGVKFYNKSATAKDVKQDLLLICSTDSRCKNTINTYFKECFDSSYRMGSRHRSGSLNNAKLSHCLNSNSKTNFFSP